MKRETLERLGKARYGYGWQSKLAKELGYEPRTIRAWLNGTNPMPKWLYRYLRQTRNNY